MTTSCSIVSVLEKARGKHNTRKPAHGRRGAHPTKNCTVYDSNTAAQLFPAMSVAACSVTAYVLGGCLVKCSVSGSAPCGTKGRKDSLTAWVDHFQLDPRRNADRNNRKVEISEPPT